MAKDLQWFKFSPLNWMTGRIRKESPKVQIAFIEIMCQYWKNGCRMTSEQAELEIGDSVAVLLKRKLIKQDGDNIKIQFLDEQMVSIEDTSVQKSNAAKSRWNARAMQVNADAMHVHKGAMQNDADKRREDKIREYNTHGSGKNFVTINKKYLNDKVQKIHDLRAYYQSTGQLETFEASGWVHFDEFVKANTGKMFNEPDHLYNTFRNFCIEYKPPQLPPDKYKIAAFDKTLWTPEVWEKAYSLELKNDLEFRKHFGYNGKLSPS